MGRLSSDFSPYPKQLNREIHGLRGFSALAVFVFHIYGIATEWGFWPAQLDWSTFFFRMGRHGVEIFFVISGYLITASLLRHRSVRQFLLDRCIRVYPVFLTIQILIFSVGPLIGFRWLAGVDAGSWLYFFLANALFLPGIVDVPLAQPSAWSLTYEAAFYLVSAAAFVVAARLGRGVAIAIGAVLLLASVVIAPLSLFFLVGIIVYATHERRALPAFLRRGSILALAATLALLALAEDNPLWIYAALPPALLLFASIVTGEGGLSRVLRSRFLQYLGTISYSFYLWFGVVTYPLKIVLAKLHGRVDDVVLVLLFAIGGLVLSVLVAHLSYIVLEQRVGHFLRMLTRNRRGILRAAA